VVRLTGHGGAHAVAAARQHGVSVMFTLSGGHVFPLYDAVVKDGAASSSPAMRLVDVRHEQTAVFAAEATARLTRTPGLAVVTAGPGVTNSVSAVTTAWFNGAPVVVLAGRAPDSRWGSGSLQEMDHPPLLAPVTKRAWTEHDTAALAGSVDEAFRLAASPHRGPVFLDISLEAIYGQAEADLPARPGVVAPAPDAGEVDHIARLLRTARHPVLVLGSDVWLGGAEDAAPQAAQELRLPVIANGQARGVLPRGHELLVTRARSVALRQADLVIVAGTPLDFRLGYGSFGPKDAPARVVHVADAPGGIATHVPLAASASGDLAAFFTVLGPVLGPPRSGCRGWPRRPGPRWRPTGRCWPARPIRYTRPVSTASCSRYSTTTRWSSATAATSSRSPASTSSRSGRADGSIPDRLAAWAPDSATPLPPGSRAPPHRSCCCSATARPASR
jgi:acetolactate synthase-1/2/3 large subunit